MNTILTNMECRPTHTIAPETCYFPVEININGAGDTVQVEKALPLLFDTVEGVLILNPGGGHGEGKICLSVGGEEIFPDGFHVRCFTHDQTCHHQEEIITKELDNYLYPFWGKAKGATASVKYTEPRDGKSGVLYLVFKLVKQN